MYSHSYQLTSGKWFFIVFEKSKPFDREVVRSKAYENREEANTEASKYIAEHFTKENSHEEETQSR